MERVHSFERRSPVTPKARPVSPVRLREPVPSRGRPESRSPSHHGSRSRSSSDSMSRSQTHSPSRRRNTHHHHQPEHRERERERERDREEHRPHHHQSHHDHKSHHEHHEHHHGLIKSSASLLAGIGLATVLAKKVFPKGVPYGEEEDRESRSSSSSSSSRPGKHHHHHHHHHQSSERHSEPHHRRPSDAAEYMVHRARSIHGRDALYAEEADSHRRSDSRRMSLDPRALERLQEERTPRGGRPAMWEERHRPAVLPYPETPYPSEKFYEPRSMRVSMPEPVPVSR